MHAEIDLSKKFGKAVYDHKDLTCPDLKDSVYLTPTSKDPFDPLQIACALGQKKRGTPPGNYEIPARYTHKKLLKGRKNEWCTYNLHTYAEDDWFKKWKKHAVAIVARNLGLNPTFTSSDEIQFDADLAATSGVDYYPKTLECEYSFPWRRSRLSIKNSSYLLQDAIWNWDRHYWQHRLGLGLEIPIYRDWALQMGYKGEYWSVQGGVPGNMSGGLSWRIPLEEKRWVEWSLGAILERESQYAPIHLGVKLIW